MKRSRLQLAVGTYLAAMVLIHAAMFWETRDLVRKGYSDFTIYYCAGSIVRSGLGHQLYDDDVQFRVQREFAPAVTIRQGPLPYNHLPFEAAWFAPLTYFSYPVAFLLWDLANPAMLAALPWLLRPYLSGLSDCPWWMWLGVCLAFFPIFFALLQGQDSILLMFLYALAYHALRRDRQVSAGVWLGLGLFKFHLVLPFVVLLVAQRKSRVLYGLIPVAIVLAVISVIVVGPQGLLAYPKYVLHLEETFARGAIVPSDMPNLRGILYLLFPNGAYLAGGVIALSAGLLVYAARRCRSTHSFDLAFALGAVTTYLVSYHGLGYDLSILMVSIFLIANYLLVEDADKITRKLLVGGLVLLFFSPLYLLLLTKRNQLAFVGWAVLLLLAGVLMSMRSVVGISKSKP